MDKYRIKARKLVEDYRARTEAKIDMKPYILSKYDLDDFPGVPPHVLVAAAEYAKYLEQLSLSDYVKIVPYEHLSGKPAEMGVGIIHEEVDLDMPFLRKAAEEMRTKLERKYGVFFEPWSSWATSVWDN